MTTRWISVTQTEFWDHLLKTNANSRIESSYPYLHVFYDPLNQPIAKIQDREGEESLYYLPQIQERQHLKASTVADPDEEINEEVRAYMRDKAAGFHDL